MTVDTDQPSDSRLGAWLHQPPVTRRRGHPERITSGALRFAFYGRMSTLEHQHDRTSRQWQHDNAARLITGHGRIVAEYFDIGHSRSEPWAHRPQAAALLAAVTDPDRAFDAIVVGEYERAFTADQILHLMPTLNAHGVQLWLPEAGGPINLDDPEDRALVRMLGHQSQREILRSRFRTTAAMRVQARDQGRHLGGRPPYGYRLVDAGPHPNQAHARWGRRLQRLDPDTAPHVRWMFALRLAGESAAGIARTLNHRGIPSPAAHDRARNRNGDAWTLRTVAAILANPRYTGRQVWNRQRTDHHETVPGNKHTSHGPATRHWNPKQDWVISTHLAHPPLVSEDDFVTAQTITAVATPDDGIARRYLLTGLLICRACGRRLEPHWVHHRPGYRCRHGRTSASPAMPGRSKALYLREDETLQRISLILAERGAAPGPEPTDTVGHLRAHDLTTICEPGGITLDNGDAETPPAEVAGHFDPETATPANPDPTAAATPAHKGARIPRQHRGHSKNPHQSHPTKHEWFWWGLT
jgi:site-specific DNA recombinase